MIDIRERAYLAAAYADITLEQPSMADFLAEATSTLSGLGVIDRDRSLLDIGCGRGYLLEYLRRQGYANLCGIDLTDELVGDAVFSAVRKGSFEHNDFADKSFDTVLTCHTLHHLHDPWPVSAIQEMARIARRNVAVIEINNTNLPMYLLSALRRGVEINAFRYNRARVVKLIEHAGLEVEYAQDMQCGYLSGNSWLHWLASKMGASPYNVIVAKAK